MNIQRQKEASHLGPGSTEYLKPFGSEVRHKMHSQGRHLNLNTWYYKEVIDSNEKVGPSTYKPDDKIISPSIRGFKMSRSSKSTRPFSRSSWLDKSPTYDNPGSGYYDVTSSY